MLSYQNIPLILTGLFTLIMIGIFIYVIRVSLSEERKEKQFDKQLQFTLNPDMIEKGEESWIRKQLKALPELLIKSEMVEKDRDPQELQRKILLVMAMIYTITTLLSRNPIVGIFPMAAVYGLLRILASSKLSKKRAIIEEQIPGFVATFKANIQANQHSQNAMIRAIENTASPLYDELVYAKSIMEAGDFKPGIIALRMSTDNDTLRQMATCIELASTSGSNIEEQITIIESIIEDKQKIERKKKLGVNENKPLFIVSALFIPISFFGSYFMSEMHRDYWGSSMVSWLIIVGVIVIMTISSFATWKVIQKVEIG